MWRFSPLASSELPFCSYAGVSVWPTGGQLADVMILDLVKRVHAFVRDLVAARQYNLSSTSCERGTLTALILKVARRGDKTNLLSSHTTIQSSSWSSCESKGRRQVARNRANYTKLQSVAPASGLNVHPLARRQPSRRSLASTFRPVSQCELLFAVLLPPSFLLLLALLLDSLTAIQRGG